MPPRPPKPRSITITVPGPPRPKMRHRLGRYGVYDPAENKRAQRLIGLIAAEKLSYAKVKTIFTGPLYAALTFYLPKPKSKIRKNSTPFPYPDGKPDIDNLEKLVYDALNGIIYVDDGQIVTALLNKRWAYDREPRVEIIITEMR